MKQRRLAPATETGILTVKVHFPLSQYPVDAAMNLRLKEHATVEDLIICALWNHWEQGWLPAIATSANSPGSLSGETKDWTLRVVDEMGLIDFVRAGVSITGLA